MQTPQFQSQKQPLLESLERRILFDASACFACGAEVDLEASSVPDNFEPEVDDHGLMEAPQDETVRHLVVIDAGIEESEQFINDILSHGSEIGFDFVTLHATGNGIEQINSILSGGQSGYNAVHIVSHGESGRVRLGNGWLDQETVEQYSQQIASWGESLSDDADLLFYGCELASDESGIGLIERIGQLTDADVAASDDLTGAESLGGDWILEHEFGAINSPILEALNYHGTLAAGEISGTVNDVTEESAQGLGDVLVTAYDDDNRVAGAVRSDADGNYVIRGLSDGQRYRVVFTDVPSAYESASVGPANDGSVVFALAGSEDTNFEVHRPEDFCEHNADVAVSCYVNGTHDGDASDEAAIVTVEYGFDASSEINVLATIGEVGSTFGMAHQYENELIYSASFLKRNTGFGPEGMDAIYLIDSVNGGYANNVDSNIPIAIHLSDFGINVGEQLADTDRGLSDDPRALTLDQWGWDNQFRLGIGDIDISDDGNTLYVMNLNDHDGNGTHGQVVILDISDPTSVTLKGTVEVPNLIPGATDSDVRAFATKFHEGNLYIGVTATAESTQQRSDMAAAVYQLDATESAFSLVSIDSSHVYGDGLDAGPTDVIPLDYERGVAYDLEGEIHEADFQPWTNDASVYDTSGGFLSRPQPLLTDIEFDNDGSMMLAFANRDGYQIGDFDIYPGGDGDTRPGVVAGELLRIAKTGSGFELEGGSAAPSNATGFDNLGPGGGEFYFRDNFFSLHEETTMGALAILHGSDQLVSTVIDPLGVHSGGLNRYNSLTGGNAIGVELYDLGTPGTAAKGAGLGDVEVICHSAPVEIGNYIWNDLDRDGIQDAGELALSNVEVGLFDENGALVATVETDINGRYLFSSANRISIDGDGDGLNSMEYGLDICARDCNYIVGILDSNYAAGAALEGFTVTTSNVLGTSNDQYDHSDSDAVAITAGSDISLASYGLEIVTQGAGANNHTFDFGFYQRTSEPPVGPPPVFDIPRDGPTPIPTPNPIPDTPNFTPLPPPELGDPWFTPKPPNVSVSLTPTTNAIGGTPEFDIFEPDIDCVLPEEVVCEEPPAICDEVFLDCETAPIDSDSQQAESLPPANAAAEKIEPPTGDDSLNGSDEEHEELPEPFEIGPFEFGPVENELLPANEAGAVPGHSNVQTLSRIGQTETSVPDRSEQRTKQAPVAATEA